MRVLFLGIFMSMFSGMTAQTALLELKKGACFGQCPVYDVSVNLEGEITFTGKRFEKNEGVYKRQLSQREMRKLKKRLRKAKFHKLEKTYNERTLDVPETTYIYYKKGKKFQVKAKLNRPEKLEKLDEYVASLLPLEEKPESSWTLVSKPKNERPRNRGEIGRKELANSTLIVELKSDVDINIWLKKYHEYGARLNKKLVPNRPLYLIQYDESRISGKDLLKRIKQDKSVIEAQTNQKTSPR